MRIGVFGGTFDPPHIAHLVLASEAQVQLRIDRLLWVLTPDPPHKKDRQKSPMPIRLELLEAALEENPSFELSRVEIDRPGPHYAVDTVRLLQAAHPGCELYYLIGGDSLRDLPTWFQPQTLVGQVTAFGVMRRPGDAVDLPALEKVLPGITAKVCWIDTPLLEISASAIRERVRSGRPFRYFLPERVYERVERYGLYKQSNG